MTFTVESIATMLGGTVVGDGTHKLNNLAKIEEATTTDLAFVANPKYAPHVKTTGAGAILVNNDFDTHSNPAQNYILVDDAYTAFATLLQKFAQKSTTKTGIAAQAIVDATAKISDNVYIGALAVIEENCIINSGVQIYPQVYIAKNVVIGANTVIFAGVKIYANTQIGANCIIHSGVVIGADGFGFAPQADGTYKKIAQNGNVIIQNDVEIGANTTIDCATMGATVIETGVKIDNLVQIAHNVTIGAHTVIAAQTAVAGSVKVGKNCMIGGQVGIAGHLSVADGSQIGGKTGIYKTITEPNKKWFGILAKPHFAAIKEEAVLRKLPLLEQRIGALENHQNHQDK
jgi:UDP-3-O-[3-hydroxymyristoyl] glucosamine N-acyltransferase